MIEKSAIYTSTPIGDTGGVPKFNTFAFPAHDKDVEIVYLNGHYPEIEALCRDQGLTVKPFSAFRKPTKKVK
jgi:hypothetical protein